MEHVKSGKDTVKWKWRSQAYITDRGHHYYYLKPVLRTQSGVNGNKNKIFPLGGVISDGGLREQRGSPWRQSDDWLMPRTEPCTQLWLERDFIMKRRAVKFWICSCFESNLHHSSACNLKAWRARSAPGLQAAQVPAGNRCACSQFNLINEEIMKPLFQ